MTESQTGSAKNGIGHKGQRVTRGSHPNTRRTIRLSTKHQSKLAKALRRRHKSGKVYGISVKRGDQRTQHFLEIVASGLADHPEHATSKRE